MPVESMRDGFIARSRFSSVQIREEPLQQVVKRRLRADAHKAALTAVLAEQIAANRRASYAFARHQSQFNCIRHVRTR